MKIIKVMN